MGKMIELNDDNENFEVYEAMPDGEVKGSIIVIHEIWALNDHTKDIADRYASEGYHAVAPNLLSELDFQGKAQELALDLFNPEKRNEAQPKLRAIMTPMQDPEFGKKTLGKLKVLFDYLYAKPEVHEWVAVTGYCFGGSYSYALAINEPRLKAAIPYYGHVNLDEPEKLQNISCPILAFYGEKDEGLISALPKVKEATQSAGVNYTAQVYSDCGHAFFNDTNPYAYNETAAKDSWQRSLEFLAKA